MTVRSKASRARSSRSLTKAWKDGKFNDRVWAGGRPKGTKNSTYELSPRGLKVKQRAGKELAARMHKEGKAGGYFKNHPYPESARQKNRRAALIAIEEGRLNPAENIRKFIASGASKKYLETRVHQGAHGLFCSAKNRKKLHYDSSWELMRMEVLERCSAVVGYRKNPIRIPYSLNGRAHYYWPDFLIEYLDGSHVLEEIKPAPLVKLLGNQAKFRAAKAFCRMTGFQFRILDSIKDLQKI